MKDVEAVLKIGCSSLSEYETGKREPRLRQLQLMAEFYNRPLTFFLEEDPIIAETILWRQCPDEPSKTESMFRKLVEQYRHLESWCNKVNRPNLEYMEKSKDEFGYEDAEKLALTFRSRHSLGNTPARVLQAILEEICGVKIFVLPFNPPGAAASFFSQEFGPAILLNSQNVRWRRTFDLAHELFHILSWKPFGHFDGITTSSKEEEKLATCFARNLLMPIDAFIPLFPSPLPDRIDIGDIFTLARFFDVSHEAIINHATFVFHWSDESRESILNRGKEVYSLCEQRTSDSPSGLPARYFDLAVEALNKGRLSIGVFAKYTRMALTQAELYFQMED